MKTVKFMFLIAFGVFTADVIVWQIAKHLTGDVIASNLITSIFNIAALLLLYMVGFVILIGRDLFGKK